MANKQSITSKSCDRFDKCTANICPLDPEWAKREHLKGERVCFYMVEVVKDDAEALFKGRGRESLFKDIQALIPLIASRHQPIKNTLEVAKNSGSRMARKIGS